MSREIVSSTFDRDSLVSNLKISKKILFSSISGENNEFDPEIIKY